jgi:cytochrome P450
MSELSSLVPKPSHVPDAAVYDFDMYLDPALLADPHERIRQVLRDAPPIFWTPRNGGHWIATGHAEVFALSRDTETFSSELIPSSHVAQIMAMVPAGMPRIPLPTPINLDPPDHTRYRAPLQLVFSPKAMLARRDEIRALANSLIDKVIDQGCCDFIPDIAEPLPVQVFLRMMGLPLDRQAEFRDLVHAFLAPPTGDPTDVLRRMRSVADAMKDVIEARRSYPQDDLISQLWRTEIDGKPMTFEVMEDYAVLLFIAGLDTVINGMGYGIRHLARNPGFQARLRTNPKLVVEAAEEILRRYTFTVPSRRVAKDAEFGGLMMKEGDRLMLYLPAADLDSREFDTPEKFDIDREKKTHIAFGAGPHRCLGSHLARIELQIVYEQMLARLPNFRLDDRQSAKFHGGNIIAIDSLPIRWD